MTEGLATPLVEWLQCLGLDLSHRMIVVFKQHVVMLSFARIKKYSSTEKAFYHRHRLMVISLKQKDPTKQKNEKLTQLLRAK